MDILIIAVLIITAVILFLVELFPALVWLESQHWDALSMPTIMRLQILEWREDLSLWAYRPLPVSVH